VTVLLPVLSAVVCLWLVTRRANELCVIRVRNGEAVLVRGRAPARLLHDIGDIARRAALPCATIRVVSESASPRVYVAGAAPEAVVQQVRNVVGEHQVLHFRTGRRAMR
jgi:hypothetical protein